MSNVPLDAAGLPPQKLNGVDTLLHRGGGESTYPVGHHGRRTA